MWLFDEGIYSIAIWRAFKVRPDPNVAVPRLWSHGLNAKGRDVAFGCRRRRVPECGPERFIVGNEVIRWQQQHNTLGVDPLDEQRRNRRGRSGIAANRLQDDFRILTSDFTQLFGDDEAMLLVADDDRGVAAHALCSCDSLLKKGLLAQQGQ
jgi:hypothetical protein